MRLNAFRGNRWLIALAALLALAGIAWVYRAPLLSWYDLRGLAGGGEDDRESGVERVAGLGEAALPGLLDCLGRADAQACANAEAALACLARRWGPADDRTLSLADR